MRKTVGEEYILYSGNHEGLQSSKSGGTADRIVENLVRPEPEVQDELLRLNQF